MIQKVEMYQVVCDRCGRPCAEISGIVAWATPEFARIAALESGWIPINNGLYCPDCVEYDEETDSYKPKDKIRNEQIGHTESLAEKERGKVQE